MPSTVRELLILSSYSRLDGANSGGLQTVPIMISTQHQNTSGQDLTYFDDQKNENISHTLLSRLLVQTAWCLHSCVRAYDEENIGTEEKPDVRTVLHFHPALAPVKIGVLPLSKKLNDGAEKVFAAALQKIQL